MNLSLTIMRATWLPLNIIESHIIPFVLPSKEQAAKMIRKCWLRKKHWEIFKIECHVFKKSLYSIETLHYRDKSRTPAIAYKLYISEWRPVPSRSRPGKTSWRHELGAVVQDLDLILSDAVLMTIIVETWKHGRLGSTSK